MSHQRVSGRKELTCGEVQGNFRRSPDKFWGSLGNFRGTLYCSYRGPKQHKNFFNINFWAPTQNTPFWAPRKKLMCFISWERTQKREPHKLFSGGFWVQKGRPKRAIFGHKKFSLLFFFSCPYLKSHSERSSGEVAGELLGKWREILRSPRTFQKLRRRLTPSQQRAKLASKC